MNIKVLKRKIKFILEPIYNYFRRANHRHSFQFRKYYQKLQVVENTIFYESRDGKSLTDSPYAIFKYIVNNPDYREFKHIWSVSSFEDLNGVINQYKGLDNVSFVQRNSKEYLKCLATSKYLINNSTFQPFFIPKDEQVYINTWHGTPLKSMGFDIPGNPANSKNVLRNFLSADFLLSPNEHTTNMFLDSYKLKGIYRGEIIQEGYPRIDLTLRTHTDQYNSYLAGLGLKIDKNKKTILYAPTWKGNHVSRAKNDMYQIIADMNYLKSQVENEYNLLIKVHPFLYEQARKFSEIKDILVPDFVDTNELLSVIDVLITDYSSIFFDYLVTDKPILFYVWDYEDYDEERGRYLSDEELPGPTLFTIKEVASAVQNITQVQEDYQKVYQQVKERFTNHDDGNVTKRIVEYILNKNKAPLNVINHLDTGKKKILIYPGGMRNNGITSSFINLMDNIDYTKYDVSILMNATSSEESLNNMAKVNKNARFVFRHGAAVYSFWETYRDKFIHNRGAHSNFTKKLYPEEAYKREYKRYVGRSQFDYVIDFSGYSLFWAKFLLAADAKKKICYMHNDLLSDSERTINGRKPHRINLRGLFSVYNRFDKLVSVSVGTMELNKKNLSKYADESKFDYVMNSINIEKILKLSTEKVSSKNQDEENSINHQEGERISYHVFKSRAIITKPGNHFVWNRVAEVKGAEKVVAATHYLDKEVTILREACTETDRYYKFSLDDRIEGWLHEQCFELLPDSVIFQEQVDKWAVLKYLYDYDIWSKPYKIEDIYKVSTSNDYKGMLVKVDLEARTQHGIYSRFSINGTVIGWIDSSVLSVVKKSGFKARVKLLLFKIMNYQRYKRLTSHLDKRSLVENNLNETLAIESENIPEPSRENYNFINMGRLSPEKGQDNLIKAFAKFHEGFKNSKLYILGEGPLRKDLEDLIIDLRVEDSVFLVGQQDNPFKLMNKCDCFVLSSHYEGQPMVLLEALTLGMKIIATDIVANRTVLEQGRYGLLVEDSIEGLEKGLNQLARHGQALKTEIFSPEEYNKKAMGTFYKALE